MAAALAPFWPNSINSMPVCSRNEPDEDRDGSQTYAAKQGCVLLPETATMALRGTRKAGKGGGGMDRIELGGGPSSTQSPMHIVVVVVVVAILGKDALPRKFAALLLHTPTRTHTQSFEENTKCRLIKTY